MLDLDFFSSRGFPPVEGRPFFSCREFPPLVVDRSLSSGDNNSCAKGFALIILSSYRRRRIEVLDRGEKIELLVDKTENLQFQADSFQRQGRQLRRKMWLQSLQTKLIIGVVLIALILILWLAFKS